MQHKPVNAFNMDMIKDFKNLLIHTNEMPECRAVIITSVSISRPRQVSIVTLAMSDVYGYLTYPQGQEIVLSSK